MQTHKNPTLRDGAPVRKSDYLLSDIIFFVQEFHFAEPLENVVTFVKHLITNAP